MHRSVCTCWSNSTEDVARFNSRCLITMRTPAYPNISALVLCLFVYPQPCLITYSLLWLLPAVDSVPVILMQDPISPPLCEADVCSAEQPPQLNQPRPLLSCSNSIVNLFQTLSVLLGGCSRADLLWQLESSNDASREGKLSLPLTLFICNIASKTQKNLM